MSETMPFLESNDALTHPEELRVRMRRDGYLFFRSLIDREAIQAVRRDILALCRNAGWLAEGSPLIEGRAAPGERHVEPQPDYMAVYDGVMKLEAFHALAHDPAMLAMYRDLLGEAVLVHPRNIARIIFPQNTKYTTPAHQDFIHIQGAPETFTSWIPLGDCPRALGSLSILAGSHRRGLLATHAAYGAGGRGVHTEDLGPPVGGERLPQRRLRRFSQPRRAPRAGQYHLGPAPPLRGLPLPGRLAARGRGFAAAALRALDVGRDLRRLAVGPISVLLARPPTQRGGA